jgi:formate-dependent nitrite reductase cytochrome c552 subunit
LDNNTPLDAILARLRPEKVAAIRAAIEDAIARQFGDQPDPAEITRFLDDIRVAQAMSGIDIDYAEHYTHMHKAGVDFMALIQAVKAADKDSK